MTDFVKFNKIRNIILWALLGVFIAYSIYAFHELNLEKSKNPAVMIDTTVSGYDELFNQIAKQKLSSKGSLTYKLRNPISVFSYDGTQYGITVTKINTVLNFNLNTDITMDHAFAKSTGGITVPFQEKGFNLDYRSTSIDTASKIHVSLNGDSITTVASNDSIVCYYLKVARFAVKYNNSDINEVYAAGFVLYKNTPANIMFYKKNNVLYFLTLTPDDKADGKMDPALLNKLIVGVDK
jgi:hypothetical protein